ncbi:MAG: DUF3788 domain-containing protein [Clostridiales bacterium]|nr:DUF3788 domain-containing protein [Clostridiales bacterium]
MSDRIDLKDMNHVPTLEEFASCVRNELFGEFCKFMQSTYRANAKIEFSRCSWEYGWNVKFKKSGRTLCTLYPREGYFTALVVIGKGEKEAAEQILPELPSVLGEIYHQTEEGNGQRWLMVDLEDQDEVYAGVKRLIQLRYENR